ncbi:MAG: hypothetical protein J1E34_07265 [Oscillospiraceae bacterium]|nr:hypothetical protein [Oscillospiraceae bacterium]
MRYQEILDEIVQAIKGGAGWDGKGNGEEVAGTIDTYSSWLYDVISEVMNFFRSITQFFSK